MSDMNNHHVTAKKAVIYRMVMPSHTCPFGIKALDLLRRRGFEVAVEIVEREDLHFDRGRWCDRQGRASGERQKR